MERAETTWGPSRAIVREDTKVLAVKSTSTSANPIPVEMEEHVWITLESTSACVFLVSIPPA